MLEMTPRQTAFADAYILTEWISSIDADLNEDDIPGSYAEVSDHYRDQWVGQSMGIESTIREALDAIDADNGK